MSETVRLAVPTEGAGGLDAERSSHFGHAGSFTLIDVEDGRITASSTITNPPHTHGGCGLVVNTLAAAGVSAAIVIAMGPGPLAAMGANGMEALFDDVSPTPRAAAEAFIAGARAAFGGGHVCRGH